MTKLEALVGASIRAARAPQRAAGTTTERVESRLKKWLRMLRPADSRVEVDRIWGRLGELGRRLDALEAPEDVPEEFKSVHETFMNLQRDIRKLVTAAPPSQLATRLRTGRHK